MKKSAQAIAAIKYEQGYIVFYFHSFWYQEEIKFLSEQLLSSLSTIQLLETIAGADRENIRFIWQINYYFSLNFDCYSQSCWLEGEDEKSHEQLVRLIPFFKGSEVH
jgi:hypothetical protein